MDVSIWDLVLTRIQSMVNAHSYSTWFKPTSFVRDAGETVIVGVPDPSFGDWLQRHYAVVISEALVAEGRDGTLVSFVTPTPPPEPTEPEGDTLLDATRPRGLNPRYTFDSFIVGPSNQFAHAACRAIAEAPSRSYNPLFIYGGVGLGKTHLMHAIGHYVLTHYPNFSLTYITSERFMNEMINALRYDRILDFRARYRSVDVLLVDDIQFVSGKEGTQTEFFHTFNALYEAPKQIVLSSDRPPHEITNLEERLRSRFEWGLIADIQPPDIETKIAILKRKASTEGVPLSDDVAMFIAGRSRSNIRELEGALTRLIAHASLYHCEITVDLAKELLRNLVEQDDRVVTIEAIQRFVADYYQLRPSMLTKRSNSKSIAMPRQVAMYLCKSLTPASLPEIGRRFDKHHSTVIHSIKKVEDMRSKDPVFNNLVIGFIESFR